MELYPDINLGNIPCRFLTSEMWGGGRAKERGQKTDTKQH